MTLLSRDLFSGQSKYGWLFFIVLTAAGLAANYFKYQIFFSIDFLFGSIFAMLALQMLGVGPGILSAAIISSITYQLWNHPYAIIIMTLEVLVVGLLTRRKNLGLVLADMLYWVCLGVPLVFFFYFGIMHLSMGTATITMMKQSVNGIANAMAARFIFMALSFGDSKIDFSLREIVFNLLALFVLAPSLFLLAIQSRNDFAETERAIRESLVLTSQRVSVNLEDWLQSSLNNMVQLAAMAGKYPVPHMQRSLEQAQAMTVDFLRTGLIDRNANSVAFSPLTDELGQSNIGKNYADRPFIPRLKQTLRPTLSEVVMARIGVPKPAVSVLAPVVADGRYAGYVIGVLDTQRLQKIISQNVKSQGLPGLVYTMLDRNGRIIVTSQAGLKVMDAFSRGRGDLTALGGGISQWVPFGRKNISVSDRWRTSFYVAENRIGRLAEWQLVLEQPIAPLQEKLYKKYVSHMIRICLILLAALALAEVLSRRVMGSLANLKNISSDMPVRVLSNEKIVWPDSNITETKHLIDNFKDMTQALAQQVREIQSMNALLEERVSERTEKLKKSEEFLNNIVENIPNMIFVKDAEELRFVMFNRAGEHLLGYSREELLGKNDYDMFPVQDAEFFTTKDREVLNKKGLVDIPEEIIRTKSRGERILHTKKIPVLDENGEPKYLLGISEDITDLKMTEAALQKSEAFIKNILETVDEGFIVVDRSYRILSANKAFCNFANVRMEEVLGVACHEASHHQEKPCFETGAECPVRGVFETSEPCVASHAHTYKDGSVRHLEIKAFPLRDATGKVIAAIETINDVTEKKHLEEQLRHAQKLESLGTLAGGVAHDFNNILTAIVGYSGMMEMRMPKDDPNIPYLREVMAATERASHLTEALLIFSRKQSTVMKQVNINALIEGMRKTLLRLIRDDIETSITLAPGNLIVMGDYGQLEQVLMNFVTNARDSMPDGGSLSIETSLQELDTEFIHMHGYGRPGKYVLMSVADTGAGMDERTRERIFEPFFTTKAAGKGTGLGLAIVYGIVKQHLGYINCYSEPGKGTIFRVYLPAVKEELPEMKEADKSEIIGGNEMILVADDDESIRRLTRELLEKFGYTVIVALDGADAVIKFLENKDRLDLVLLDVIMPRKSGREAFEEIRGIRPEVKILFMSGYTEDIIQRKRIIEDELPLLQKPAKPRELLERVRAVLDAGK